MREPTGSRSPSKTTPSTPAFKPSNIRQNSQISPTYASAYPKARKTYLPVFTPH